MVLCLLSRLCITHSEPFLLFPESVQVAVCHHKLVISHIPFRLPQNTIPLHYMMFTLPLPSLPSQQSGSQPSCHMSHTLRSSYLLHCKLWRPKGASCPSCTCCTAQHQQLPSKARTEVIIMLQHQTLMWLDFPQRKGGPNYIQGLKN